MTPDIIKNLIENSLLGVRAEIYSEDNHHFEGKIIGDIFTGKSRLEQQRLVNQVIAPLLESGKLHAFSFKTYTPQAWEQQHV